jgi:hypothetical protein
VGPVVPAKARLVFIKLLSQPCKKKVPDSSRGATCTRSVIFDSCLGTQCISSTKASSRYENMATVLPPPNKRQRTDAADRARQQQDIEVIPSDAGTLRLQFYDETTGLPIGQGPVLVPVADATPKNLELLLNTLQGHVRSQIVLLPDVC